MTPKRKESRDNRIFWDSDCILGWLREETDKVDACEGTLEAAKDGKLVICISSLAMAEVLWLKPRGKMNEDKREKIESFFDSEFLHIINLDPYIAAWARELIWSNDDLEPKDAVHAATACFRDIPILNTFDSDLISLDGKLRLRKPGEYLRIMKPDVKSQLTLLDIE